MGNLTRQNQGNDPKTPQQLNEAVAEKLGLDYKTIPDSDSILAKEYLEHSSLAFAPATDPAAALWALERLGKKVFLDYSPVRKRWSFVVAHGEDYYGTFCKVICEAIVGASE